MAPHYATSGYIKNKVDFVLRVKGIIFHLLIQFKLDIDLQAYIGNSFIGPIANKKTVAHKPYCSREGLHAHLYSSAWMHVL